MGAAIRLLAVTKTEEKEEEGVERAQRDGAARLRAERCNEKGEQLNSSKVMEMSYDRRVVSGIQSARGHCPNFFAHQGPELTVRIVRRGCSQSESS